MKVAEGWERGGRGKAVVASAGVGAGAAKRVGSEGGPQEVGGGKVAAEGRG